ncbi:MAG: hypothetical protein JJU02_08980 [Cryomorphaceae bacterium]|nr:hypothetical protein [Cryomorphaceae bacterium]
MVNKYSRNKNGALLIWMSVMVFGSYFCYQNLQWAFNPFIVFPVPFIYHLISRKFTRYMVTDDFLLIRGTLEPRDIPLSSVYRLEKHSASQLEQWLMGAPKHYLKVFFNKTEEAIVYNDHPEIVEAICEKSSENIPLDMTGENF